MAVFADVFPTVVRLELGTVTSGSNTVVPPNVSHILFQNASTAAAQTVTLPANPVEGTFLMISNVAAITALTLSPTVAGTPTGLTAGQGLWLLYSGGGQGWFVFKA